MSTCVQEYRFVFLFFFLAGGGLVYYMAIVCVCLRLIQFYVYLGDSKQTWKAFSKAELPTPDYADSSLKINQSLHVLMSTFENLPDHGNFFHIMLNVTLNISLIIV